jgi:cytochrome b561
MLPMNDAGIAGARYGKVAMAFHWVIAVLIVLNFLSAWAAQDQPRAVATQIMGNHKAFGLTILALSVLRIAWRFVHRPPPLSEQLKAWEAAVAKVTHTLFYFLMIAIPLAGWAMVSSAGGGKPVSVFGRFDVPALPFAHDKATADTFHDVHETLAALMLLLLALHVGAALKHQFVDRDTTLARMVPFLSRRPRG